MFLLTLALLACEKNPAGEETIGAAAFVKTDYVDTVTTYGPARMVRNLRQTQNGDILIAAYNGIFRYDGKSFTNITSRIPSPSFWDVLEDRHGNLWMGTKDSGVYRFDGKEFRHFTTREGLPGNTVLHLHEDRKGNIWFASGFTASRFDGKTFRHFTPQDGLAAVGVNTFFEDQKGRMWIGTRGDAYRFENEKFTLIRNQAGETFYNVWSFAEDQKGNVWFGGSIVKEKRASTLYLDVGLWRYNGETYQKVKEHSASSILADKEGNLWTLGTENAIGQGNWQLMRFDAKTLQEENPTGSQVFSIPIMLCQVIQARDGSIWFGSGRGVFRYDGQTITDLKKSGS